MKQCNGIFLYTFVKFEGFFINEEITVDYLRGVY